MCNLSRLCSVTLIDVFFPDSRCCTKTLLPLCSFVLSHVNARQRFHEFRGR